MSAGQPEECPSVADIAAMFSTLLPGDDLFPTAGDLDLATEVERRVEIIAPGLCQQVFAGFVGAAQDSREFRIQNAQAIEAKMPDAFTTFLTNLYLCYYETDTVHAAINRMGKPYNTAPQPNGYELPAFEPSDMPSSGKGWYLPTDQVRPIVVPDGLTSPSEISGKHP